MSDAEEILRLRALIARNKLRYEAAVRRAELAEAAAIQMKAATYELIGYVVEFFDRMEGLGEDPFKDDPETKVKYERLKLDLKLRNN